MIFIELIFIIVSFPLKNLNLIFQILIIYLRTLLFLADLNQNQFNNLIKLLSINQSIWANHKLFFISFYPSKYLLTANLFLTHHPILINQNNNKMNKDSLLKYRKKVQTKPSKQNVKLDSTKRSSSDQFQKYFLDTTNVFYEDRDSLKNLQSTNSILKVIVPIWFFIAFSYAIIGRIHAYEGKCPQNATCKVFIRCNPGYQLSQDGKHCVVQARIIEQIENVCKFEIQSLKLDFGDNDCLVNDTIQNTPPYKNIIEIERSITKTLNSGLKEQVKRKIHAFLSNVTNQNTYEYSLIGDKIIPLNKKHSFKCWFSLICHTQEFQIFLIIFILSSILGVWWFKSYKTDQKVKKIYNYLKEKLNGEERLNVTLLTDQIQSIFGPMDELLWEKINQERKKEAKIGYYEDQFLFWRYL